MSDKNYKHTILAAYGGYITQAVVNNFAAIFPTVLVIFTLAAERAAVKKSR